MRARARSLPLLQEADYASSIFYQQSTTQRKTVLIAGGSEGKSAAHPSLPPLLKHYPPGGDVGGVGGPPLGAPKGPQEQATPLSTNSYKRKKEPRLRCVPAHLATYPTSFTRSPTDIPGVRIRIRTTSRMYLYSIQCYRPRDRSTGHWSQLRLHTCPQHN